MRKVEDVETGTAFNRLKNFLFKNYNQKIVVLRFDITNTKPALENEIRSFQIDPLIGGTIDSIETEREDKQEQNTDQANRPRTRSQKKLDGISQQQVS